ncbi:ras and EF-hand domain-containing -like protein [Labeo rohita]|uniref:Ras and EF-hand domain-containing-like protein n=1 Tax=Labeo rohita TaxID=84645 RepID=A0A498MAQ6_LABRO|nr:ras and EF-hand domain-containing -like protein [Labeo rohita]
MNRADLRRLFAACDGNKSGRVEYEDFTSVCRELNVPADEIRTLFNKFDLDGDGYINFNDFSSSFQEVSEALNLALLGNSVQMQKSAWDEFENTLDGDVAFYLGRQWDELREMYEQIHSTSDELLLQQYEDLIKALVAESKEHRMESEQLETSLRRTEELTSSQLVEMEEDLQQQLARTEKRVREEEQKKLDESIAMLQIKHENELADLQTTIERLTKQYQEESKLNSPREDAVKLRAQIRDLMQENEELRSSLVKAQINVSILQVELDRLKNAFTDQKLQHERESDDLKKMVMEYQSYSSQIEFLQFRSIARSYFRKAHGVLLLYDVTSESSFLNVREWVEQIRESTDQDIPMCIIGNKVDLRTKRPEGSCVSTFDGEKLAMAYNALFCEASAKEGTSVIEAVLHLAREVKKNAKLGQRSESQVKLSLHKQKTTLTNCCGV